jgi:hypothetical protein
MKILLVIVSLICGWTACPSPASLPNPVLAKPGFKVYDNMFYKGKPNTENHGLVPSNILYERNIWPSDVNYGALPDRSAFERTVRAHVTGPGPLVLDIERLPLKGTAEVARRNMETLAKLSDWARKAAPGKAIGLYGTNTLSRIAPAELPLARELARHVDAFFPPMYTFNDDREEWEKRAQACVSEAHELGPGKPVLFYLWPQYHDGTPKAFKYVDKPYWKFQLETARRYADGIVLWSPSRYSWDESSGWWSGTLEFMSSLVKNGLHVVPRDPGKPG